jgi:hypothetical protein
MKFSPTFSLATSPPGPSSKTTGSPWLPNPFRVSLRKVCSAVGCSHVTTGIGSASEGIDHGEAPVDDDDLHVGPRAVAAGVAIPPCRRARRRRRGDDLQDGRRNCMIAVLVKSLVGEELGDGGDAVERVGRRRT